MAVLCCPRLRSAVLLGAVVCFSAAVVDCSDAPYAHNWRGGLVLSGVDVVAYHTLDKDARAVYGKNEYAHTITRSGEEYTFLFSTAGNLELFQADMDKYIPRLGGYCSWGLANEWQRDECDWNIDSTLTNGIWIPFVWKDTGLPGSGACRECDCEVGKWPWSQETMGPPAGVDDGWSIYNGRLYFNIWDAYRRLWLSNVEENLQRAEARWIAYYGGLDQGPLNIGCYGHNWRTCASEYPADFGRVPAVVTSAPTLPPGETASPTAPTEDCGCGNMYELEEEGRLQEGQEAHEDASHGAPTEDSAQAPTEDGAPAPAPAPTASDVDMAMQSAKDSSFALHNSKMSWLLHLTALVVGVSVW